MEKINQFSAERFLLLLKRSLIFNNKTWLIGLGANAGVLLVISLLHGYFSEPGAFNIAPLVTLGHVMIFIGGYILTSMSFNEIHSPARSQFYLTLPATTFEKLSSQWLISSVLFIIATNIVLFLSLLLANVVLNVAWAIPIQYFHPFSTNNLQLMSVFLVTQSIFFLGSVYFRKNNFLKTVLSVFVISTILQLITVLIGYLIFGTSGFEGGMIPDQSVTEWFEHTFPVIMKVIFYGLLAPFCLVVSYFKLKEREV